VTAEHGCYVTVGIAEIDPSSGLADNTGALIGPEGYIGKYRKVGLNPDDQLWFTFGSLGYPVFETKFGKFAMVICYNDTYLEIARTAAVKGAQIVLLHVQFRSRAPTLAQGLGRPLHNFRRAGNQRMERRRSHRHRLQQQRIQPHHRAHRLPWRTRIHLVAARRENRPSPGVQARRVQSTSQAPFIHYGEIDPADFDNPIEASFAERRPAIYGYLVFYRTPYDPATSTERPDVSAVAVQYAPVAGDCEANTVKIGNLVSKVAWKNSRRLMVLPEYSFTGLPSSPADARA
jgi:predicted amidohydrolase